MYRITPPFGIIELPPPPPARCHWAEVWDASRVGYPSCISYSTNSIFFFFSFCSLARFVPVFLHTPHSASFTLVAGPPCRDLWRPGQIRAQ